MTPLHAIDFIVAIAVLFVVVVTIFQQNKEL
jgi:hypothetical protein